MSRSGGRCLVRLVVDLDRWDRDPRVPESTGLLALRRLPDHGVVQVVRGPLDRVVVTWSAGAPPAVVPDPDGHAEREVFVRDARVVVLGDQGP